MFVSGKLQKKLIKREIANKFPHFYTGLLFNDVYSASKFAVEGFCESLAVQALKFNIK